VTEQDQANWNPLRVCGGLFAFALLVHVGAALWVATRADVPLSQIGVCFDGNLYLEIARSFPLPYSAEGIDYVGQPPGYPALAAFLRIFLPSGWVNWGGVMLIASWIPAALAAPAFYLLGRELGIRSLWPAVLFVVANPRWLATGATAHAESLAMLLVLMSLWAALRDRLGWSVVLLALTGLTRLNLLLLGIPIAAAVLSLRRNWNVRAVLLLSIPLWAIALFALYLRLRFPEHPGILEAHRIHWNFSLTWPFASFFRSGSNLKLPWSEHLAALSWASAAVYVLAAGLGLRLDRNGRILSLWIAVLVLFHASLAGALGVAAFTRLALMAWPAALLILWLAAGRHLPHWAPPGLCAAFAVVSFVFTVSYASSVVQFQLERREFVRDAARRLDADEPVWFDFHNPAHRRNRRRSVQGGQSP